MANSDKKKKKQQAAKRDQQTFVGADFDAGARRELAEKIFKTEKKIIKLEAALAGAKAKLNRLKSKHKEYGGETLLPGITQSSDAAAEKTPSPYSAPPNLAGKGQAKPSRLF